MEINVTQVAFSPIGTHANEKKGGISNHRNLKFKIFLLEMW